jgi:hypothetical protein
MSDLLECGMEGGVVDAVRGVKGEPLPERELGERQSIYGQPRVHSAANGCW